MSSGRLGKADLAAAANTDLYTVPASTLATANVAFCNRTSADIPVRLAVRSAALANSDYLEYDATVPANSDYLEYDATVPANGALERTGIVLGAGEIVTVYAAAAGVSARVHGFEEMA